jgi:hypothetical protein
MKGSGKSAFIITFLILSNYYSNSVDSKWPQTTPHAWAHGVSMGIDDPAHRSALWAAVTALESGLFSERPTRDLSTVRETFVQILTAWRPPLVHRDAPPHR